MDTQSITTTAAGILLAIGGLAATIYAAQRDEAARQYEEANYCAMTTVYKYDTQRGVPKGERRGWPEYKGAANCEVRK